MTDSAQDFAARTRDLFASSRYRGVLCTFELKEGYPYGSVVEFLPLDDGDLVLLLSNLAEHSRNLANDARASLVVAESMASDELLALGRATLLGQVERIEGDVAELREAYVARHPTARSYVDFPDFAFYRLRVERVRYIGGFGRMGWIDADAYRGA